jgi:lia operon protein LiaG
MRTTLFALLVVALPVGAQAVDHRTLPSPAAIYDIAGTIHVVRGTGSDITVDITRGGSDADRLTIATGVIGDRQTLRVLFPSDRIVYPHMEPHSREDLEVDDDGTWDNNRHIRGRNVRIVQSGSGLQAYADLTIHVPPGARLAFYLGAGTAAVANVDGDLLVDVAAASITAEHTHGALTLDTGSGDLVVNDAQGDLMLDAGSGDVRLTNIRGDRLDVDAGSGEIQAKTVAYGRAKLDLGSGTTTVTGVAVDELSLDAGSGNVDVALVGPAHRVSVDAGSGDVTLHLPKAFAAQVEIDAGSGSIRSDFALERSRDDDSHYTGRIGDGAGRLSIDSGSGTVALLRTP